MSNTAEKKRWWTKIGLFFSDVEEKLLSSLLLILIVISCGQILLRGFDTGGLLWADPLLRHLVVWSGFLGAAMASSKGKHISLDIIGHLLPEKVNRWVTALSHIFSALVAAVLTWASVLFIISEKEFGPTGLMGIPSYLWNLIFPLCFCLMTVRYFSQAVVSIHTIISAKPLPESTVQ